MDLSRFLLVMSGLFFLSVDQSEEAGCSPYKSAHVPVISQEGYSWTGNFKVPRWRIEEDSWIDSLAFFDRFEKVIWSPDYLWEFSIKVGEVTSVQGRPNIDPFRYVQMKVFCYQTSLDLAYFTTRSSHHNVNGVIVVDSISWSDGVITVKRGQDVMVLNIEMFTNCGSEKRAMSRCESWYAPYPGLDYCQIYDIDPDKCDTARKSILESGRMIKDICFDNVYDGDSCGLRMTIMRMTGIFFEKFRLTKKLPSTQVTVRGYYLNGTKDINLVYPCYMFDTKGFFMHCKSNFRRHG